MSPVPAGESKAGFVRRTRFAQRSPTCSGHACRAFEFFVAIGVPRAFGKLLQMVTGEPQNNRGRGDPGALATVTSSRGHCIERIHVHGKVSSRRGEACLVLSNSPFISLIPKPRLMRVACDLIRTFGENTRCRVTLSRGITESAVCVTCRMLFGGYY